MKFYWINSIVLLTLSSICMGDVSHLKLSPENRQYLPPNHAAAHSIGSSVNYWGSQTKNTLAAAEPLRSAPKMEKYIKNPFLQPTAHLLAPANTERIYYSHAPYSIFHTQINVQSQDNEYNAGRAKIEENSTFHVGVAQDPLFGIYSGAQVRNNVGYVSPSTIDLENNSQENMLITEDTNTVSTKVKAAKSKQAPRTRHGMPYKSGRHLSTLKGPQKSVAHKSMDHITYTPAASNIQQTFGILMPSNMFERGLILPNLGGSSSDDQLGLRRPTINRERPQIQYEESNIQGLNILNSNLHALPLQNLAHLPGNRESNIQGVNILNSNIFGLPSGVQSFLGFNGYAQNPLTPSSAQLPVTRRTEELAERENANVNSSAQLPVAESRRQQFAERENENKQSSIAFPVAIRTEGFAERGKANEQTTVRLPVVLRAEGSAERENVNVEPRVQLPEVLRTEGFAYRGNLNDNLNTEPGVEVIDNAASDEVKVYKKQNDNDNSSSSEENETRLEPYQDTDLREDGYHYKKPRIAFFY